MQEIARQRARVDYPDSDGEPLGETDFHVAAILYLRAALHWLFRDLTDVYVAANMLFYYEEGEPASRVSPDVFAVRGIAKHQRRSYKLWEERATPCLAIEVTSRSSRLDDVGTKRGLYEMLGVSEYLIFDPLGEYLEPRFRVFELAAGGYRPVELDPAQDYRSRRLPAIFRADGAILRVVDPATGLPVPLLEEAVEQAAAEYRRAEEESRRAEEESRRAEGESRRAEGESRRAEGESRRAKELASVVQRYREKFGDLEGE